MKRQNEDRKMAGMGARRLHGTTWNVYLCVLTSREPKGVREIWRDLNLSSPSLAQYHVNKLLDLRLIEANSEGKYLPNRDEQMEVLRSFIMLRGRLIPRFVVYGTFLLGMFATYLLFWPFRWDFRDLTTLAISLFAALAFFLEAFKQYRGLTRL